MYINVSKFHSKRQLKKEHEVDLSTEFLYVMKTTLTA